MHAYFKVEIYLTRPAKTSRRCMLSQQGEEKSILEGNDSGRNQSGVMKGVKRKKGDFFNL